VALDEVDVLASGGAGQQDALQCGGAKDAPVQVGDDGGEVGGPEAGGEGAEVGRGGTVADRFDQVAAVGEKDADGVKQDLDVGAGKSRGRV
jgi:hypothetical protein